LQLGTGVVVTLTHSYVTLFVIACAAYPVAFLIIHGITPKLAPARMK
jgi:hypothetical protein